MADSSDTVEDLIAQGEAFVDVEEDVEALACFRAAWAALPEPKEQEEAAARIWAAIADCHFHLGEWEACRDGVQQAFRCGEDMDNPFLRLRLGQALYEMGDEREAANWLVPAYLSEGRALFADDD